MRLSKLICVIAAAFLLFSCSSEPEKESESIPAQPEILTHVYTGDEIVFPEGYEFNSGVTPLYQDGVFTVLCRLPDYSHGLVSFDMDGTILSEEPIQAESGNLTLRSGVIREDSVILHVGYFSSVEGVRNNHVLHIDRTDGTRTLSPDLIPLFTSPEAKERFYQIRGVERDGDGYYYFFSETELIVLDPDLNHVLTCPGTGMTECFAVKPDGTLTVYGSFAKGSGLYTPNPETKIPDTLVKTGTDQILSSYFYDPDGNLYYEGTDGFYITTETGSELLMDFRNSGLTADRLQIYSVPDRDCFLGGVTVYGTSRVKLQIFRKSEDIVVSEIDVIDIADLGGLENSLAALITDYNLFHRDRRLVVTDYSDMEDGETQLMMAIQTGTYQPDMIIGAPENSVIRSIVEDGLYTDLTPYLETDDELNSDNLFGSVKRIFDDDGKMWGISPKVTVHTVNASREKVGDRSHWTLEELLDYAESLPEGEYLMYPAIRSRADEYILGPAGYSMFVDFDSKTASFDSDVFVRYLEYVDSMPADYDEYYDNVATRLREALHSGRISLCNEAKMHFVMSWLELKAQFPQGGHTIIGYPSDSPASAYATAEAAYVITSFADDPDQMWGVLKGIFPLDPKYVTYKNPTGLPALKYIYDAVAEDESDMEYIFKFSSGGMGGRSYDPANPMKPEDLNEPGMILYFDEAEAEKLRDLLDNRCGTSVMDTLPPALDAIVREEVSAFLAGMGTAKDCAGKIQSRVNLWLSEQK